MGLMFKRIDSCRQKYSQGCVSGAAQVGLCLKEDGILVKELKGFGDVSVSKEKYTADACDKPIFFDSADPLEIKSLHELELQSSKKPTTAGTVYQKLNKFDNTTMFGHDRLGADLKSLENVESVKECEMKCESDKKCVAWVYDDPERVCTLKKAPGHLMLVEGYIGLSTGLFPERYACKM
ncbi:UNVERIFIED_CONTAM: hypothetical protein HDU68_007560 [Siphonaria sp. JEL0065]|nr:hypothetical protein HDU68_007560 [Siphonaria sp. JEL0065]